MAMPRLSQSNKVNYSDSERRVFKALRPGVAKSTIAIANEIYTSETYRPFNDRQTVLGALNSLSRKVRVNREPFTIAKSKRQGPRPINFWIEQ